MSDPASIVDIKSLLVWAGLGNSSPTQLPSPTHQSTGELGGETFVEDILANAVPELAPAPPDLTPVGAFLALTGFQPTGQIRSFAHVSEAVFTRTLDDWEINGNLPNTGADGGSFRGLAQGPPNLPPRSRAIRCGFHRRLRGIVFEERPIEFEPNQCFWSHCQSKDTEGLSSSGPTQLFGNHVSSDCGYPEDVPSVRTGLARAIASA